MIEQLKPEALHREHGNVVSISLGGKDDVALRKCKPAEYKRFRARSFNEKTRDSAIEELVRCTLVYPPRESIDALFETYPALAEAVSGEVLRLAGMVEIDVKK